MKKPQFRKISKQLLKKPKKNELAPGPSHTMRLALLWHSGAEPKGHSSFIFVNNYQLQSIYHYQKQFPTPPSLFHPRLGSETLTYKKSQQPFSLYQPPKEKKKKTLFKPPTLFLKLEQFRFLSKQPKFFFSLFFLCIYIYTFFFFEKIFFSLYIDYGYSFNL